MKLWNNVQLLFQGRVYGEYRDVDSGVEEPLMDKVRYKGFCVYQKLVAERDRYTVVIPKSRKRCFV